MLTADLQERLGRAARADTAGGPLQGRARHRRPAGRLGRAGRRPAGAQHVRQQLPRPLRPPAAPGRGHGRASTGGATACPRCASSAARRRCTASSRSALSGFLGTEDTILYSSCFDANGGLFETLLADEDAIISDELNHASIIDGVRLCKAQRFRYRNADMADLEEKLQRGGRRARAADRHRRRLLDGRHHRPPAGDLRPGRALRGPGHGRRLARRRGSRRARPRHARALRRDGPHRHPHRHAGQGAGRRQRRLHVGSPGDRRDPAAALAALSLLEHAGAGRGRRLAAGARAADGVARARDQAARQHGATSAPV